MSTNIKWRIAGKEYWRNILYGRLSLLPSVGR